MEGGRRGRRGGKRGRRGGRRGRRGGKRAGNGRRSKRKRNGKGNGSMQGDGFGPTGFGLDQQQDGEQGLDQQQDETVQEQLENLSEEVGDLEMMLYGLALGGGYSGSGNNIGTMLMNQLMNNNDNGDE